VRGVTEYSARLDRRRNNRRPTDMYVTDAPLGQSDASTKSKQSR
jgi:hypothetical protein